MNKDDKNQLFDYSKIILDSIADGVFTVDLENKITYINSAAVKILGISKKQALGKLCYEVFHANICEHSCALKETMRTGKNISCKKIYVINSFGEKIPISISTAILFDDNEKIIGGVESFRDISDLEELRKTVEHNYSFSDIVSKDKKMQDIFAILPRVAESDSSVIIEGASGTGKELIANALHNLSSRKDNPLVIINCAALPDNLMESELFGYEAGAFTDAKKKTPGKIVAAQGGTLFLDEIGDLSLAMQVKLLRFLQHKEYSPLGSIKTVKADIRIIAATNIKLDSAVKNGTFRDDLYYRLNVINIELPLLKERNEDIPLLIRHFIKKYNALKNRKVDFISDEAMNVLMNYDFPGNIRELENIVEHAFVLCRNDEITIENLPVYLHPQVSGGSENLTLESMEKLHILNSLNKNKGSKNQTASDLGIDASTLWRKLKKYNIE